MGWCIWNRVTWAGGADVVQAAAAAQSASAAARNMRSVMDQSSTRCPDGRAAATAIGGETPVTERVCCILVAGSSKIRFEEPNAARLPAQSQIGRAHV